MHGAATAFYRSDRLSSCFYHDDAFYHDGGGCDISYMVLSSCFYHDGGWDKDYAFMMIVVGILSSCLYHDGDGDDMDDTFIMMVVHNL